MYGKGIIKQPEIFNKVASQVDVLPTIASITQTDYVNSTMGRDLMDKRFDQDRYAFTIEHGGGRVIGLLSDKFYFRMRFDGTDAKLHELDSDTPRNDVSAQHPEISSTLAKYTAAMRDTILYMRENNKSEDIVKVDRPGRQQNH
jgi:hypothetical protein